MRAFRGNRTISFSKGNGASTTATGSGPNRRYRNSPAAAATTPSKKPRKILPKPPLPPFFAICDVLLRKLLPWYRPRNGGGCSNKGNGPQFDPIGPQQRPS